jgi:hypothetical protein
MVAITQSLLSRLIEVFTLELDIPLIGTGSTTYRQKTLKCGLER